MRLLLLACASLALAAADGYCQDGSKYNNGNNMCYTFVPSPDSFFTAESYCVSLGGTLAKIQSGFENAFILDYVNSNSLGSVDFWVGGSYHHGQWMWIDWSMFTYTKWAAGYPSVSDNQCVSMSVYGRNWKTQNCQTTRPFICMSPSSAVVPPTCPPPQPCPTCPTFPPTHAPVTTTTRRSDVTTHDPNKPRCPLTWTYFEESDSCYWTVHQPNNYTYFSLAEQKCHSMGAHLASVHNSREFMFVSGLVGEYYFWTSIFYDGGQWLNTDGSPVDYKWDVNAVPKYSDYNCVRQQSDQSWAETECSTHNYFICKKPAYQ